MTATHSREKTCYWCGKLREEPPKGGEGRDACEGADTAEEVKDSDGGPTSGVNSGVHEGGQAEVGQDEEEDQAIVERHSGRDDLRQPGAPAETQRERDSRQGRQRLGSVTF